MTPIPRDYNSKWIPEKPFRFPKLPNEIITYFFEFIDPETASCLGAMSKEIQEIFSEAVLARISTHPMINEALKLRVVSDKTTAEKRLGTLDEHLSRYSGNRFDMKSYFSRATKLTLGDLFHTACRTNDAAFIEKHVDNLALGHGPQFISTATGSPIAHRQFSALKALLSHMSDAEIGAGESMLIAMMENSSGPRMLKLVLHRPIPIDRALSRGIEREKTEFVNLILESKKPLNPQFQENCGVLYRGPAPPTNSAHGLHSALIYAAHLDRLDYVEKILLNYEPSQEILQHVRDRIQLLKDNPNESRKFFYVKTENPIHRDAILARLDQAIAARSIALLK